MGDGFKLMQEADKALASASGGFSFFSNKESKMQDAAENYTAAAHAFRTNKKYEEAAVALEKAARVHYGGSSSKMLNEPDDAARLNDEASKQYRLAGRPDKAIDSLHRAADYWYAKGNVTRAGQARGTLGEWLCTQVDYHEKALDEFTTAAEYYNEDQKPALASKWRVKAADTAAVLGSFSQALQWYSQIADEAAGSPTMKYSAKNYLFNACMCALALNDEVTAKRAVDKLAQQVDPLSGKPMLTFFHEVLEAMFELQDPDEMEKVLQRYQKTAGRLEDHQRVPFEEAKKAAAEAQDNFS